MDIASTLTLHNGVEIPRLGLGVYRTRPGDETRTAVQAALECGYRHIDTARVYNNEIDVGYAVRQSGLPREQVFVTTKLWNEDHGRQGPLRAFDESLRRLGLEYIDLYLVHWPVQGIRGATWEGMTALLKTGKCRAIGVSNYTVRHLEELLAQSGEVPAVNQVECTPYLTQVDLRELCGSYNIVVAAYSPLTKGRRLTHAKLGEIAARYERTPAQILIRWGLQRGMVVLPKSTHPERIRENANVFDFVISKQDMEELDSFNENLRTGWDPRDVP